MSCHGGRPLLVGLLFSYLIETKITFCLRMCVLCVCVCVCVCVRYACLVAMFLPVQLETAKDILCPEGNRMFTPDPIGLLKFQQMCLALKFQNAHNVDCRLKSLMEERLLELQVPIGSDKNWSLLSH